MLCKKCGRYMREVFSFSKEKAIVFLRCPNCHFQTKGKPYTFHDTLITQKKYIHGSVAPPADKEQRNVQRIHNNYQGTAKA